MINRPSVGRVGEEVALEREMVSKDERVFWASISLDWVWTTVWRLCIRRREKVKQCRLWKKKSIRRAMMSTAPAQPAMMAPVWVCDRAMVDRLAQIAGLSREILLKHVK